MYYLAEKHKSLDAKWVLWCEQGKHAVCRYDFCSWSAGIPTGRLRQKNGNGFPLMHLLCTFAPFLIFFQCCSLMETRTCILKILEISQGNLFTHQTFPFSLIQTRDICREADSAMTAIEVRPLPGINLHRFSLAGDCKNSRWLTFSKHCIGSFWVKISLPRYQQHEANSKSGKQFSSILLCRSFVPPNETMQ